MYIAPVFAFVHSHEEHSLPMFFFMRTSWSCGHAKTPIPGKPSKSGLIGVWQKDNLYLGTSTIGNGDPHPTNIDSRTRSIRMMPRSSYSLISHFSVLQRTMEGRLSHQQQTHKVRQTKSFINWNGLILHVWLCSYL
jgi:hypothetical protein